MDEAKSERIAEHVEQQQAVDGDEQQAQAAARQVEFEKNLTFFQTVRIFWRSTLWILYGQLVVFGYGIDGIVAGNLLAIPRFREDYGELFGEGDSATYIIPATWQSLYGGVSQLGAILGAAVTGWLADRIGRRYANILSCAISIIGVAIQYISTRDGSLPILTAGKAVNGLSIGAWLVIGPLYASEVAPLKLRGWLTAMTNIIQFSGVLVFTGIIYRLGPQNDPDAYIIPFALLNTIGRRPMLVWGQLICAFTLFIIGGFSIPGHRETYLVTIAFMFLWGFVYQFTLGTVAWTVVAEIPSWRLRSRTQGLANMVLVACQWLVGFVFPYMFNPDSGNLGGKVGFIFGFTTLIGSAGCWLWLPETRNRTVAELDKLYSRNIKPRHFQKTTLSEDYQEAPEPKQEAL
ncbi:hypothetical protein G7Z17_g3177 [Cylindrodendrum hubeiense]|uniref:Major facilitator superfamily (MFS) profile domain-containing protein n=1 Tax=Cylindrodendrum hubeiense TaxID=595255 RepID=A0A9P5LIE8_9HYPO|nr:hypothetical protein G7Z17_g3177 [Cylindrodendrum hubeiense]